MKSLVRPIFLFALVIGSPVYGASVFIESHTDLIHSFYLNGEEDNGKFDTIIVEVVSKPGYVYTQLEPDEQEGFTPFFAGDPWTFVNDFLGAPTAFGGHGFSVLGERVTPHSISFTAGPLGQTIDTASDPNSGPNGIFLFNYHLNQAGDFDAGSNYEIHLVRAGTIVRTLTNVPEPSSMALVGLTLAGLAASTEQRSSSLFAERK